MKITKLLLPSLTMIGLSAVTSVNAATITSQTFATDQVFETGGQTSWTEGLGDNTITYSGGGLGFVAASKASGVGIQTVGGTLRGGHMSGSGTGGFKLPAEGKYAVPDSLSSIFDDKKSGFALFSTVDLSGHDSSTMTLNLATTIGGSSQDDDAMFVRLYLDGLATGIDVLTMFGNSNTTALADDTTFAGGLLTYTFDDTVTSAELIIGFHVDEDIDYYTVDNVSFDGTVAAVPEPTTTALLALGGLALILRRRR
ncbi:PEP-CTERM sorting domain-containing protein [Rubritalea profundi]|uniref:Ice-binding protein C-terminal domain-containing protein n=1 Tax=Rubritalea profundi TaxID=1658618 RepID=A0A2S7U2E5_9BACT|nr:PEP-CTERM sorting domain-containing protein [Rubritalea profundi]PQJ28770.1 hypothetical protein BSZ32_09855 [Rubritalea profundi]